MLKLTDSEKKVLKYWLMASIIVIIFIALFTFNNYQKQQKIINEITSRGTNHLLDKDRYYTVKGAITKYYSFINMHDYSSVIKLLDEDYISKNNINEQTLKKFVTFGGKNLSFKPHLMCIANVKNGIYQFVTDGEEFESNTGVFTRNVYYQITLDGNLLIFSIKPIDKNTYEGVCNG